jgi:ribosomal protein S19
VKSSNEFGDKGRKEVDWEDREVMKRVVVMSTAESRAKAIRGVARSIVIVLQYTQENLEVSQGLRKDTHVLL